MITELFFLGHVPDVLFCPLSISYECITEEQLYLFELLGIPKPKESLSVSCLITLLAGTFLIFSILFAPCISDLFALVFPCELVLYCKFPYAYMIEFEV